MDPLSEVLQDFRLTGVAYGRGDLASPWGIAFEAQPLTRFHFLAQGECWLFTEATGWEKLRPGEVVLLPQGVGHRLASHPQSACHPVDPGSVAHFGGNVCALVQPGDGATATLFSGTMALEAHALHPLLSMMPPVLRSCDMIETDPVLGPLLDAMQVEAAEPRVGGATVLSRMADLLAARIIRSWFDCTKPDSTGWLAGMRDPQVSRALVAIHREPGRNWTLNSLARLAGMSRSVFAERFGTLMCEGAAHYVARWRMQVAREALKLRDSSIATIAAELGYESEASFSRAFKRITGEAPGSFRRATAAPAASGRSDILFGQ